VLTKNALETPAGTNSLVERQPLRVEFAANLSDFPDLPVLPETLLLLELKLHEPCVDLREMSQLVLGDLGAALQIMRLAGREYGNADGRPARIEDCIADLGLEACLDAVSAKTVTRDSYHAITETWAHCREIAEYARLVAEEMPEINPEEAYLVGLLHTIGSLPAVLGWNWRESGAVDDTLAGFRMARRWSLPRCVMEFFCEMHLPGYATRWMPVVEAAHERANRSSLDCPFEQGIRPRLHRCG
jgi:HD-like signal output (HDOD) protein